jgi:hypothetical protein
MEGLVDDNMSKIFVDSKQFHKLTSIRSFSLAAVEDRIFEMEETYFNETMAGNLMKGFEHYIDTKPNLTVEKNDKKKRMEPEYRWFSYSSWSFS